MNTRIARHEMTSPVRIAIAFLLAMVVGATLASAAEPGEAALGASGRLQVTVEAAPGAAATAAASIDRAGGEVIRELGVIEGLVAHVPAGAADALAFDPAIRRITPDGRVTLDGDDDGWENATAIAVTYDAKHVAGSMYRVVKHIVEADEYWDDVHIGEGVGVALIDSGVVPVDGLTFPGKIVNGPDLSLESQVQDRHHLDTNAHGTHLAGIIAGRDDDVDEVEDPLTRDFLGIAPGAHIVSVKVADHEGSTDVSQVIAAIDWVVEHRDDPGLNIRVLNLAFGTDGTQPHQLDPLAFAVEQAWSSGIVVVVSAGNDGNGSALRNPATDPFVITVGASDSNGTKTTDDDFVATFSSCGTAARHVDVVAPGRSIVSLRNPGSAADLQHPEARVGQRFFVGSGTSQAAAVVSGAAALIIDQRPGITPNQVKELLMTTARPLASASSQCQGAGLIDLGEALDEPTPGSVAAVQQGPGSSGAGSLEAARGSHHIAEWVVGDAAPTGADAAGGSDADPTGTWIPLVGEHDIFGVAFNAQAHAMQSAAGAAWQGGTWNGSVWSGSSWSGSSWSGSSWSGSSWSGGTWSGSSWSGGTWSGSSWSGGTWSGGSWSGSSWSGSSWSGSSWSGNEWSAAPLRPSVLAQRIR